MTIGNKNTYRILVEEKKDGPRILNKLRSNFLNFGRVMSGMNALELLKPT